MRSHCVAVALAAFAPLAAFAQTCDVAATSAKLDVQLTVPESVAEYQTAMASYPTEEEIQSARETRNSIIEMFDPRTGYASTQAFEDDPMATIDVPARFCGLTYAACGEGDFGCAGVGLDTTIANNTCTEAKFEAYAYSLLMPATVPIILGLIYLILMPLWYFLRCCSCCGGRKPGKGKLCGLCCNSYYPGNDPSYLEKPNGDSNDSGCCTQVNVFRLMHLILFLLCAVAALIGYTGNSKVDAGLSGFIDVTIYEGRKLVVDANSIITQMNAAVAGAPGGTVETGMSDEQVCEMGALNDEIDQMEADVDEFKDIALDYRMLGVQVLFGCPLVFSLIFFVNIVLRRCWFLTCSMAGLMLIPGLLAFISGGAHLALGLVLSDLCYDMDLHIHYYVYSPATRDLPEDVVNMPGDSAANSLCGPDGELAFLSGEINNGLDSAIQGFCGAFDTTCSSTGPDHFFMSCDSITLGGDWTGTYPNYANTCDQDTAIATLPANLMVRNIASDPRPAGDASFDSTTLTALSPSMKTCLALTSTTSPSFSAAGYSGYATAATTLAQATAADWVWDGTTGVAPAYGYTTDELAVLASWTTTPPTTDEVLACLAVTSPLISVADCATQCTEGLAADISMKALSTQLVTDINTAVTAFTTISTLMANDVQPLLDCKFIGDIYEALYYPLCTESMPGIMAICASNLISGIAMIFAFPIAVMSTKRVRRDHFNGCCKLGGDWKTQDMAYA